MSLWSAWLILGIPLAGAVFNALIGRKLPGKSAGWIGTLAIFAAFVMAVVTLLRLESHSPEDREFVSVLWDYANTIGVDVQLAILIDPLAVYMAMVVTGISTLIHLYSVSYMWSDKGYGRFFVYLNFFVFSMLLLVLAGNFFFLIVGWAFVGAASYLLISYWYRRRTATQAGIKAFVMNVIGDVGLVLGTYFLFKNTGTLDFVKTFEEASTVFNKGDTELVVALLLLLVGAVAKSAQIPLHTWLPDAMEGPTPVSALIHAATMVTAGVYLIARMHPLFELAPAAATVGMIIGATTLFVAATIAITQKDLKKSIAYSTMSQIGYMIMGVSAGAYVAGLFHLMTHAFFKALLFLAAGSVISAMANVQNMDRMGGFRKAMPVTFICFLAGAFALAAFPPFSGYFSKDEILLWTGEEGGWEWILYVVGYAGALITAIYTFRLVFRVFFGEPCPEAKELEGGHLHHGPPYNPTTEEEEPSADVGYPGPDHHIAERAWPMKIALIVLAIGATLAGLLQIPWVTHVVDNFLEPTFEGAPHPEESNSLEAFGLVLSFVISATGIFIAYLVWYRKAISAEKVRTRLRPLYTFLVNKYYFDELYDNVFVRPMAWLGRFASSTFERVVIDGIIVGGAAGVARVSSAVVRGLQSGYLRAYAAMLVIGLLGVGLWFLILSA
jgi:NADH-quinone oxidoreductase subunit L